MNATTTRRDGGRIARAVAIWLGSRVGVVGRWIAAIAVGGVWYTVARGVVPQTVRAVVFALLAVGTAAALEWGRNVATRCPHCRKRHQPDAAVCSHCGREVPDLASRV